MQIEIFRSGFLNTCTGLFSDVNFVKDAYQIITILLKHGKCHATFCPQKCYHFKPPDGTACIPSPLNTGHSVMSVATLVPIKL